VTEYKNENRIFELETTSYGSEGQGVGRLDGLAVFVNGALIGERVRAQITKTAPRFAEARLIEVLEKSPNRAEPPCPNFERCGGCDLMHMNYAHQLEFKRMKVENAFRRIGSFENIEVRPCAASPQTIRYRNKAVFSFAMQGSSVVSGTLGEKSHRVIETKDCLLQNEASLKALEAVTNWANDFGITAYNEKTGKGVLRHLAVRSTCTGETMVIIIAAARLKNEAELVSRLVSAVSGIKSIVLNLNRERSSLIMGRKSVLLWGEDTITERILGIDFAVAAESFLQINHDQTERLYSFAVDSLELTQNDSAVDLYCGIGTLSLLMAKSAGRITGIEYVPRSIENAKNNAEANGIKNADFLCGAAEKLLPELVKSGKRVSKLLLDPPRAGAMKPALDAIIDCSPERIAYVSCDPATLARDCKILANEGGYVIECIQPFDMFPQTEHVECAVLMSKDNA
jgi:23S rRNA (uracil1939-C5)-methyltransferase